MPSVVADTDDACIAGNEPKVLPDFAVVVDTVNASFAGVNDTDNACITGVNYTCDAA